MSRSTPTARRGLRAGGLAIAGTIALAGCGAGGSGRGGSDGVAAAVPAATRTVTVTITAANGCQLSSTTFPAGPLTFNVTNRDATAVSEVELDSGGRIVGEKENIPPGFSGTFSVDVERGAYTLVCPGATADSVPVTVTGAAPAATGSSVEALLKHGTEEYARYVTTQAGYLVKAAEGLRSAIDAGNLAGAQAAYERARPFYEKIEPVAESFTVGTNDLDADIDARINDVPLSQWEGFHRIERGLFADHSVAGLHGYAARLVANVKELRRLTTGLTFQPAELANGAQELLDEVASTKIAGEEERYSHVDVLDIANNVAGAEQAFADLRQALERIDKQLSATIAGRFAELDGLVDRYRTSSNASGFVYYGALTQPEKRAIAAAVKAVQEPLSQVASKVAKV